MMRTPRSRSVHTLTCARIRRPLRSRRLDLQTLEPREVPAISIAAIGTDAGVTGKFKVFDATNQTLLTTLTPFPSFQGGVRVAVGDLTGDGVQDVIAATGPGGGNKVRVCDGTTFNLLGTYTPFTAAQADGLWIAAGDVTGDGKADLVVGTDGNFAPRVKVFNGANASLIRNVDLSGFDAPNGVRVGAGDVTGDGKADVVIAAGPGGPPRVIVSDGVSGSRVRDFFAFDPASRVGVQLAVGDMTGDGVADILCGQGSGGGWVQVFDGKDSSSFSNLEVFPGSTSGVRVGAIDADGDGRLDVLAGSDGVVRVLAAAKGAEAPASPFATLQPFGASYTGGLFVAGDGQPGAGGGGVGLLDVPPSVQITGVEHTIEGGSAKFTVTRTGDLSALCYVRYSLGGTASAGFDYATPNNVLFAPGSGTCTFLASATGPMDDNQVEPTEKVVLTLLPSDGSPNTYYVLGSVTKRAALIIDNDAPPPNAPGCGCGGASSVGVAPGQPAGADVANGTGGDLIDGTLREAGLDFSSDGFGGLLDQDRLFVSHPGYNGGTAFGPDSVVTGLPYLLRAPSGGAANPMAVVAGTDTLFLDLQGSAYVGRHYRTESLTYYWVQQQQPQLDAYKVTDTAGNVTHFWAWGSGIPTAQRGKFKSRTDADGNTIDAVYVSGTGVLQELTRTGTSGGQTMTESVLFTYTSGKVSAATLRRKVGTGSWTTIRDAAYTYGGTGGRLSLAQVKDAAGTVLDTRHYRYYTSNLFDANGVQYAYTGGLSMAFGPDSYERLMAAYPGGATDAQAAPYADLQVEYDYVRRVTKAIVQGAGCSACSGGLGTTTTEYYTSTNAPGYNAWDSRVKETLPDGSVRTTYLNFAGEAILTVDKDTGTGQEFKTYQKFDSLGRLTLKAQPSTNVTYDEAEPGLVVTAPSTGKVETTTYYTTTTATASTAGGVAGYVYQTFLGGVLQSTTDYYSRTDGSITVYPVATQTVYRNTDGTGGQATTYAYTFFSGAIQPQQVTTTLPTVTTGQNGSGTANSSTVVHDDRGRVIWTKDEAGFLTYTSYDDVTGGVLKSIHDVDTTQTSTFADLPSGWTTPSGGGLHQTTTYEIDSLGRTTKTTDPNGNITYTVYNDTTHEVRTYPGWDSTANMPTGPTIVSRDDRARGYTESLTVSATPHLTGGRPDGTETIGSIQSLSRDVLNSAGQVVYQDVYFDLTGVTYSQSAVTLGTAGTNYNRTTLGFGKLGQLERTLTPGGTIHRTWFDGKGRPVSEWVGTDDTPTSGFFSPTNLTGTDMMQVAATVYDSGGVGDSLVTKTIQMPGSPYANRETQYAYDWRDRLVATKASVESSENTSVNRPISYAEFDNLGQSIVNEMYDGDGLSITTDANSDGVPDRPSSSALRAKSTTDFDELGRVYQSKIFSVDPSTGGVSTNSLVSKSWFNSRGLPMKSSSPGGLVSKSEFDGLGRTTKSYVTDGGGDTGYGDADDVTSDNVLSQVEYTYDANGNVIFTVSRERFHDETGTGALGTPSTGVKARVGYAASYFDKANRLTDSVDVGTNGGAAYTRPSSAPSRSDTVLVSSYGYNAAGQVESVTDPKALVNKNFYDLAGRNIKTVENYVNGVVSDVDDKTVEFTYDADGHQKTLKALLTSGYQTTEWVYGITSPIVSNDVLKEMRYPDPTSGNSSSTEKDSYTYNQLGQAVTKTDRNGNVHTYSYDILGRQVIDTVTTLGSGVNGAVRRLETAYDGQGNAYLVTSYDATTSGNVVNQVQREFDGLGSLTKEWQAVSGSVNTSTSPKVQYAWSFAPSGSTNHNRLTSITYPNGRVVIYNYASGLADNISRLSSITDGATTLESYEYLGAATVVKRGHPQPGVDLTFIKQTGESDGDAGDKYLGLDRFDRIADNRWRSSTTDLERRQYGYDRDSNRLYALNAVETTQSELYAYDGLIQLTSMDRGTLNGTKDGIAGSPSRSQDWDYDALGNWDSLTTDGGSAQTRSHNKQNEITSIAGATSPTYDANGNLTTDETGRQFVYDAWNRLVIVKNSGGSTLATFAYDALGRRVRETRGSTTTDLYYSAKWQVLEERAGSAVKVSYVWSPVYVDAMIARDRDADGNSANGLEERLYPAHDANFNVTALIDTSGTVQERATYDAFGLATYLTGSWGSRSSSDYSWGYLYQGLRLDFSTGNYYARRRDCSPTLGRWLQIDPSGFEAGDSDLYRSLRNSPIALTDPTGLFPWGSVLDGIAQATGRPTRVKVEDVGWSEVKWGGFIWGVTFRLNAKSNSEKGGYILQHVVRKGPDDYSIDYWEAWRIGKDSYSPAQIGYFTMFDDDVVKAFKDAKLAVDIGGDDLVGQLPSGFNTSGKVTFDGSVYYLDCFSEAEFADTRFRSGNVRAAGALPSLYSKGNDDYIEEILRRTPKAIGPFAHRITVRWSKGDGTNEIVESIPSIKKG